jgi:hypothetical protein
MNFHRPIRILTTFANLIPFRNRGTIAGAGSIIPTTAQNKIEVNSFEKKSG